MLDLEFEIAYRSKSKMHFTSGQIVHILQSVINGIEYFYGYDIDMNYLGTDKIYFALKGQIKIADPALFNNDRHLPASLEARQKKKYDKVYLSPEQIEVDLSQFVQENFWWARVLTSQSFVCFFFYLSCSTRTLVPVTAGCAQFLGNRSFLSFRPLH